MKTAKKILSLMLACLFAFSGVCVFAQNNNDAADNTYFFEGINNLETDEIEYPFNAKCVILPDGYKPEVKVFYDGKADDFVVPEYITLVFTDGTQVRCSPESPPVLADGKPLYVRYITDYVDKEDGTFSIEIYRWFSETQQEVGGAYPHTSVIIKCNKVQKSLGENIAYFFNNIIQAIKNFFSSLAG